MNTDDRRRELRWTALLVWLPGVAVLAVAVLFSLAAGTSMRSLLQDATTVLEAPFYIGSVSLLGVILWSMAAAVCFVAAFVPKPHVMDPWRRFFIVSGAFTGILLVDDAFLLHDEILPRYAGISGELYGVAYVLATAAYLVAFRNTIRRTNYWILVVALAFFGVSATVDVGSGVVGDIIGPRWIILLEDGAKLLGIGTWLAYFASVARLTLIPSPVAASAAGD